jgi:predicted RND superfamily exporter protein
VLVAGLYGITRLKVTGRVVDDIGKNTELYQDLVFLEKNFKGVMPLEISIDTKKKKGVMSLSTLKKIDRLQDSLANYPELSRPLSVVEVVKFAKQAFYSGDSTMYSLPNGNEMVFMVDYLPKYSNGKKTIANSFIDSNLQVTRISVQMANIGTREIQRIKDDLKPKIDSIFNPKKYKVSITGTSVVFLKGTDFLVNNLRTSLIFAIIIIAIIITFLFTSARIVIISLVPNILPQIITAGMMGYLGIPIKPSTILIFSIALGISIDNAILYLSRYRQQLTLHKWNIHECVIAALKETSFSMIYSSSVLFLGFSIFSFSSFGGTQSMGYLISFTLFIAMFCNLFLLPSLLLTFGKKGTPKSFKRPVLEIFDEDKKDISQEELNLKNE